MDFITSINHSQTNLRFITFLNQIITFQYKINTLKTILQNIPLPTSLLFHKISHRNPNYITIRQITIFYQQLIHKAITQGWQCSIISITQRDIQQMFWRFDWSRKGRIYLDDWQKQLQPINQNHQSKKKLKNSLIQKRQYNQKSKVYQNSFFDLMLYYIQGSRLLFLARKQISDIPPYILFDKLNINKTGYISQYQFEQFLKRNNLIYQKLEFILLKWAFQRRAYMFINLEVFCQTIQDSLPYKNYQYELQLEQIKLNKSLEQWEKQDYENWKTFMCKQLIQNNEIQRQMRMKLDLQEQKREFIYLNQSKQFIGQFNQKQYWKNRLNQECQYIGSISPNNLQQSQCNYISNHINKINFGAVRTVNSIINKIKYFAEQDQTKQNNNSQQCKWNNLVKLEKRCIVYSRKVQQQRKQRNVLLKGLRMQQKKYI